MPGAALQLLCDGEDLQQFLPFHGSAPFSLQLVEAQGEADALKIQAEAQAEANRILSKSITDNLVEYKKIEKWDGKMPYATGSNAIIDFSDMTDKTE